MNRDDPPDYPEPPECCGDIMDVDDNGNAFCPECGKVIEPLPDIGDPDLEPLPNEPEILLSICRHGNQMGDCDACDYEADLAFDAARESRFK